MLPPKAAKALAAAASGRAAHGMQVNDGLGKTKCIFHYHGPECLIATQVQAAQFAHPDHRTTIKAEGATFAFLAVFSAFCPVQTHWILQ